MNKTLSSIFSGEQKIMIPDLQRDYCWASRGLIEPFFQGLIEQFNNAPKKILNMGLLYWYKGLNGRWQLCDGQQRITSLFLAIGVLNKLAGTNPFIDILISQFELKEDDKEPRLQYSIRESSLYFLSDLVCHYFISTEINNCEDIPKQSWFYQEYLLDPSIKDILLAISKIEIIFKSVPPYDFGKYLADNLEFFCYDMGGQKEGEETFVIINTTGEPLSATENLKPHIIQENQNFPSIAWRWEEDIEKYFWQKRPDGNETSDDGIDEFLRIVSLIYCFKRGDKDSFNKLLQLETGKYDFDYKNIKYSEIQSVLNSYKLMLSIVPIYMGTKDCFVGLRQSNAKKRYSQRELYSILPTVYFILQHPHCNITQDARRVHHLFSCISRYSTIGIEESTSVWNAMILVSSINGNDVVEILNTDRSNKCPQEELIKLEVISSASSNEKLRATIEQLFAMTEDYWLFNGEISILIGNANDFNLVNFELSVSQIRKIWGDGSNLNIIRRALLTLNLNSYPYSDGANKYFGGSTKDDWKQIFIMSYQFPEFKSFISGITLNCEITEYCANIISEYLSSRKNESIYQPIIEKEEYLRYCQYHYLRAWDHIIFLNPKYQSPAWRYLFDGVEIPQKEDGFTRNYVWGTNIIYTDHNKFDIAIDLVYLGKDSYQVELFERHDAQRNKPRFPDLFKIAEGKGLSPDTERGRMVFHSSSAQEIVDKFSELRTIVMPSQ